MSDTVLVGSPRWFRELLDRLDRIEAGKDWTSILTEEEHLALRKDLDKQPQT